MAALPRLRTLRRLGWGERALLAEAFVLLVATRVVVLLVPFRLLAPHLGPITTNAASEGAPGGAEPARVGRAVFVVSRALPWHSPCLTQAIVAQLMLRRRRLPGVLHLGVRKEGDSVTAHAWTSCGSQTVIGGAGAEGFTPLAAFGPVA